MEKKKFRRAAGVLMPVSSLPSPYGIGTFGKDAYEFVDFLEQIRHRYWQVLPLGPTGYGDSPYQSYSAFAGNPYLVDLEMLAKEGLLTSDEIEAFSWGDSEEKADYGKLYENRYAVLHKAARRFFEKGGRQEAKYLEFCKENAAWLDDFALFMACKEHFGAGWEAWEEDIRFRRPHAMEKYALLLAQETDFWKFTQYEFFAQWNRLKEYANGKRIEIIGDIPIYMAYDSADVWAHADIFQLDGELAPVDVAGVPPDAFTDLGQKWGNPLYDWEKLEKMDFSWWEERMRHSARLYDVIRIDHFIGIVKYYTIPAEMPDARKGEYREGPGEKLTAVINRALGEKKLIAEDLGVALEEVEQLLHKNGYPGMKVLEFAFGGDRKNPHLPHNYDENCVVYGGTHDNETLHGYFSGQSDGALGYAFDYLDEKEPEKMVDRVFRLAYGSVAHTVIFQMQDVLKLGNEARMNFPSTAGGNWQWRMKKNALLQKHIDEMRRLAGIYGRENE